MKINGIKRIVQEDFQPEYQELIKRLGYSLNPMLEQLSQALDKNIDFENLNQQVVTIKIKTTAGAPNAGYGEFVHSLKGRPKGMICVAATPEDGSSYPTSAPFISYGFRSGSFNNIVIKYISGLQDNKVYDLSILVI